MKVLIIFATVIGVCLCDTKTWQRDVNYGNPDNWSSGKVPCASDTIKFPESTGAVFMQTNTTLREIILPMNGALVLNNYLRLAFSDDSEADPECVGEEQTFTGNTPENWFDSVNWAGPSGPIPVDTENVPCQFDRVVFPTDKLFYVGVDLSTSIGTVSFSGVDYSSTSSFASFISSPPGQQQFSLSNNPTITLQNTQCGDLTGCQCGNDVEPVRTKICGLRSGSCPAIACRNAVTPAGSCCPLCGALITMDYNPQSFNYEATKSQIETKFGLRSSRKKRQATGEVSMYMSKTISNKIQMVFTDSNAGSSSGQAAVSLAQDVQNDLFTNADDYGVSNVNMQSSEKGTGGLSGGVSGGGIAGIIIGLVVVVCIFSTLIFFYLRRNSFGAKDEPLHADIEMSHSLPPGFMQEISNPAYDSSLRGFDNPMYTTTKENIYASPAEVKVEPVEAAKPRYVVEEKGANEGPKWEEDDNLKAFSNPMSPDNEESIA
ncbi:protein amnionless-like [Diadema setosum]|uniref:protein amnionless-like n=1 Tax=Diadema setosum TaxID=31175 RepID=UPI003B3AC0C3